MSEPTTVETCSAPGPLAGIRVLDLGQIYQGPYAGFLLAQAGAEVVKIEPPGGEPARRREVVGLGPSFPIAFLNSGKRGITLDLKQPAGRELFLRLAERADVVLENFSPGVMNRLGVGFEVLRERNPRLVYASGTAFGLSGPDRDSLGMDVTVQAYCGVMSITGEEGSGPLKAGPALCDFLGGAHLYGGIVTALLERARTGRGRLVEVAMQETVYPTLLTKLGLMYAAGGEPPPRRGNGHGALAPYDVYPTRDGHVAIICVTEGHWQGLLSAMGREDLRDDPRFSTHEQRVAILEEVNAVVTEWTSSLGRAEVFERARDRVPVAPVRSLPEVCADPHMHERGFLQWVDHPALGRVVLPASPLRFDAANPAPLHPSPGLGEHTREVLGHWLGLGEEELESLRSEGVV